MYLIKEADIVAWKNYNDLEFIQCACRFTENLAIQDPNTSSKRKEMKELIDGSVRSALLSTAIFFGLPIM